MHRTQVQEAVFPVLEDTVNWRRCEVIFVSRYLLNTVEVLNAQNKTIFNQFLLDIPGRYRFPSLSVSIEIF